MRRNRSRTRWKRLHARQILALEQLASVFFDAVAHPGELIGRHEDRQELIAAFANLRTDLLVGNVESEVREGFLPRSSVQVDRINQSTVYVE